MIRERAGWQAQQCAVTSFRFTRRGSPLSLRIMRSNSVPPASGHLLLPFCSRPPVTQECKTSLWRARRCAANSNGGSRDTAPRGFRVPGIAAIPQGGDIRLLHSADLPLSLPSIYNAILQKHGQNNKTPLPRSEKGVLQTRGRCMEARDRQSALTPPVTPPAGSADGSSTLSAHCRR